MTNDIQQYIHKVARHEHLTVEESSRAFQIMMLGGATPAQMAALLMGLVMKGETVSELTGAASVMRAKADPFTAPAHALDTCGTGGDAKGTLNISTAVAIVTAACGVPVAKHGNRAVSSKSGSADVLKALGVNTEASTPLLEASLREANICFLMAPQFHKAMRHIAPVRQELAMRTIFNLVGPLSNPAKTKRQLLGVYSAHLLRPMAEALHNLGSEKAWVVHGSDGLDELTLCGGSLIAELKNGGITTFEINPSDLGLSICAPDALKGGDPEQNARAIHQLLSKTAGPFRDVVLLNTAAALVVADKAADLQSGIAQAADAIDSGNAKAILAQLVEITNRS